MIVVCFFFSASSKSGSFWSIPVQIIQASIHLYDYAIRKHIYIGQISIRIIFGF